MDVVREAKPVIRREKNFVVEENLGAVQWPEQCALCGGRVEHRDALSLKEKFKGLGQIHVEVAGIPYCAPCFRKISAGKRINQAVWVVTLVLGIPLGIILSLLAMRDQSVKFVFCGMVFAMALLIAYGLAWLLIKLPAKVLFGKRIAEPVGAWLITEKKRDGREGVSVVIAIPNKVYADAFAQLNGAVP
jgi:hypothetical protein